ncbi:MAG: phosphodiester glycosidase family protein [Candidatus Hydrogenedens sp.]|nr:phosphodiester glycosidase family protein [Candidatus Hydrogenedens sp.]
MRSYPRFSESPRLRRPVSFLLLLILSTALCAGAENSWTDLFQGVEHKVIIQTEPLPQHIHLVRIDLSDPHIRFTTTPPNSEESERDTRCATTLEFVQEQKAQLGINGNFFILDHQDDTNLLGLAVSDGRIVSRWDKGWAKYAINIARDNTVSYVQRPEGGENTAETQPPVDLYNVLSGNRMLVLDGKINVEEGGDRHPRTAIGLTADNRLLLLIGDGRQPGHSEGLTYHDMASLFMEEKTVQALALDGGGSSTLVVADPEARVLNVPLPTTVPALIVLNPPGVERKNGNNLAVFAAPLQEEKTAPDED